MKLKENFKNILMFAASALYLFFSGGIAYAQNSTDNAGGTINDGRDTEWYMQPWVWAIVIALIIIAIAYYSRNGSRKNLKEGTEKGLH